ncbi:hypothetical protein [Companilactobacillus mindensis]|uniref:hypothetical protein n=1 Tax=Companilactobacillus mindensis TaxID=167481 RepID=UPI0012EE6EB3|nr:hypothetical protein [Companilactobacillus mindensis]
MVVLSYFAYFAELDNTSNLRQFELQLAQIDGHSVPAIHRDFMEDGSDPRFVPLSSKTQSQREKND